MCNKATAVNDSTRIYYDNMADLQALTTYTRNHGYNYCTAKHDG